MVEREVLFFYFVFNLFLFLPTLIPLSGVGTTCFSLYCNKDSAIIFMTSACLTSTLLENGVGTVVVVVVVVRLQMQPGPTALRTFRSTELLLLSIYLFTFIWFQILWTALSVALGYELQGQIIRGVPCVKRNYQLYCPTAGNTYPL
jgi:hypothetical protein